MKTKGALAWDFHQPWSVEEIEIGDPSRGEVKVALEVAGMCHSDHHVVTGDIPVLGFPVLGGHEGAGVVVEVGEGVDDLVVGDHVAASFIPSCGVCRSCQSGQRNLCDLGMGLMSGTSVSDGTLSRSGARPERLPVLAAGDILAVPGRAPDVGGQDRQGNPLRGGGPCQLWRDDGLGLRHQGGSCPAR